MIRLWAAACLLAARAFAQTPAFPGVEGAGAFATGGRGGTVYRVTNLNPTGPGSLADAVSRPNRIVVFTVSGTIDLSRVDKKRGSIVMAQPNITIAGQTAPGEGICIRGGALRIEAGNIIIRHIRVRRGFNFIGDSGDGIDVKGHFENVILDHVSTAWATDENLTITNARNVTAQYSIAAEGLDYFNPNQSPNRHSEGSLFGSAFPGGKMTIHHTIYAHNRLRNARTTGGGELPPLLDFRNNIVYDAKELTTHTGSQAVHLNVVNNYYKDGPSTGIEGHDVRGVIFTFMNAERNQLYLSGNTVAGRPDRTADNWLAVRYGKKAAEVKAADIRAAAPISTPPVTTQTADAAFETVLSEAGATLPARDAIDLRIVSDIRNGTGAVINYETDVPEAGRWQAYHSLPAPDDTDGDGIPDYWEDQFGLDSKSAADAMADPDHDGYTNIEEYLNNTDPKGGPLPLVYVSAAVSRAWRSSGTAGAIHIARTGPPRDALRVNYTVDGRPATAIIAAARPWVDIPVPPDEGRGERISVLRLAPGEGYHTGCPLAALVAIEDGAAPQPVQVANIDREGGVSAEVRRLGEANMHAHSADKKTKPKHKPRP